MIDGKLKKTYIKFNETMRNKMKGRKMMKRGLATFLTGIMTVTLVAAGLTGCGSSTADKRSEKVRLMVWSPSEDQSKDSGEWLQTMCNTFAKEHPEWDITFVYGVADEATAADQVAQDPEANLSSTAGKTDLLVTWLYKLTIDKQYYNIGAVIGIMTFIILAIGCLLTYRNSKSYKEEGGF